MGDRRALLYALGFGHGKVYSFAVEKLLVVIIGVTRLTETGESCYTLNTMIKAVSTHGEYDNSKEFDNQSTAASYVETINAIVIRTEKMFSASSSTIFVGKICIVTRSILKKLFKE